MRIQGRCFVLAVFSVLATGCASTPWPGTGDIAYNFERNPLLTRRAERR